jgi:hypothetical protein
MDFKSEPPEGLTELEYAKGILDSLGWPMRGNVELVADCIAAISRSRKLTLVQGYKYLVRAIKLATDQGTTVDRMFFMNGQYTSVRPEVKAAMKLYEPIDWEKTRQEQDTPEFKAASERARTLLARIAGKTQIP